MKTKIIATIGPASNTKEKILQLVTAGVRIFRLNFSHGDASMFLDIIKNIREVEADTNIPITIMQDLSGPKIRLGVLQGESSISVEKGMKLKLGASDQYDKEMPFLPFDHKIIMQSLVVNDRLVLADGGLQFHVVEKRDDGTVIIEANNSGMVTSRKGLALPGKTIKVPALTEKDKVDLAQGLILGIDAVAISYVQTPEDVIETKNIILAAGKSIPVVVKLERQGAVDRLDEILREADVVMVARGDLGVECPLPMLPTIQKKIIAACNKANKPVIVATQMLLSMINNPAPTRAETTDVANAVLDGADCVMLSEETAMGNYPVETVCYMREITQQAEELIVARHELKEPDENRGFDEFLAYSACLLAEKSKAVAIISHSMSGSSARLLSAVRPPQQIYGLTPEKEAVKALNFSWGVEPVFIENPSEELSHTARCENFIINNTTFHPDERMIITAGQKQKAGAQRRGTNLVKVFWK